MTGAHKPSDYFTFNNFIEDETTGNKAAVRKIIDNQFSGVDLILINSTMGNGGTHFLSAFYNEMRQRREKIFFSNCLAFLPYVQGKRKLRNADFYFIDDAYWFLTPEDEFSEKRECFIQSIDNLIAQGKKVILVLQSGVKEERDSLTERFKRTVNLFLSLPTGKMREQIVNQSLTEMVLQGSMPNVAAKMINPEVVEGVASINFKSIKILTAALITVPMLLMREGALEKADAAKFIRCARGIVDKFNLNTQKIIRGTVYR